MNGQRGYAVFNLDESNQLEDQNRKIVDRKFKKYDPLFFESVFNYWRTTFILLIKNSYLKSLSINNTKKIGKNVYEI